ncbi:MAG: hypothetical protein ACTHN0_02850 [Aquihabitans sp.]
MPPGSDGDAIGDGSLRPGWGYAPQAVGEGTATGAVAPVDLPPDGPTPDRSDLPLVPTDPPPTEIASPLAIWLGVALVVVLVGCAFLAAAMPTEAGAADEDPTGQAIGLGIVVLGVVIAAIGLIRAGLDPWRPSKRPAHRPGGRSGQ